MQVNMLDAKNQLSRLVKEAVAGEDVVIASNGTPMPSAMANKADPPSTTSRDFPI